MSDTPSQAAQPSPALTTTSEHLFPQPASALPAPSRLARLTAYWGSECADEWTERGESATGVHLQKGDCAVDPSEIPYGSVIGIRDVGRFLAVDTGSAVISRQAARLTGVTPEERGALVVDLYFTSEAEALDFASNGPRYATISWWAPEVMNADACEARKLFAEEDLTRLGVRL